jgi:hypothetical protein
MTNNYKLATTLTFITIMILSIASYSTRTVVLDLSFYLGCLLYGNKKVKEPLKYSTYQKTWMLVG